MNPQYNVDPVEAFRMREAFEQERARREAPNPNPPMEMSALWASNRLGQSQLTQDPITVAITLQKELRKSKQATIAALEKLAASERIGCKLYEEWEKSLKLLEAEQQRSQIDLQLHTLAATEEAENLRKEAKKNCGKSLAEFEGIRADLEASNQKNTQLQASIEDLKNAIAKTQKTVEEERARAFGLEQIMATKEKELKIQIAELEKAQATKQHAIQTQQEQNKELCVRISQLQNQNSEISNEKTAELEKEVARLKEKIAAQLTTITKSGTSITNYHNEIASLKEAAKEMTAQISKLEKEKETLEQQESSFTQEREELTACLDKQEQTIQELMKTLQKVQIDRENYEQASSSLELEMKELRHIVEKTRQELKTVTTSEENLRKSLNTAESNLSLAHTEKAKVEATIQSKNTLITTLTNENTQLKTNVGKFAQAQRERDSYRSDMEQISSVLFLIETAYPLLSSQFQESLSSSSLGKSSLYPDAEHNTIVKKIQILEKFLKEQKSQSVSVAKIQSGSVVILHKNKNGHYEIITNPEAEKGLYFLDPECNPAWEQTMRKGDNIMGVVYYMSDPQEAGNDNEYLLAPKTPYQTVYVQQIDPLASVNVA